MHQELTREIRNEVMNLKKEIITWQAEALRTQEVNGVFCRSIFLLISHTVLDPRHGPEHPCVIRAAEIYVDEHATSEPSFATIRHFAWLTQFDIRLLWPGWSIPHESVPPPSGQPSSHGSQLLPILPTTTALFATSQSVVRTEPTTFPFSAVIVSPATAGTEHGATTAHSKNRGLGRYIPRSVGYAGLETASRVAGTLESGSHHAVQRSWSVVAGCHFDACPPSTLLYTFIHLQLINRIDYSLLRLLVKHRPSMKHLSRPSGGCSAPR